MSWKSFRIPHRTALLSQELTIVITPQCIYGRPGGPLFTKYAFAAVLHHQQNPEFYDEVRRTAPNILRLGDECHSCVWVSTMTDCLFVLLFLSIRLSCQLNSTRSIIYSSPSTMSAVIATARPAPKRETWLRLKVTHNLTIASFKMSIVDFYTSWSIRLSADCLLSQWVTPGSPCWRMAEWSWMRTTSLWPPTCLLDTSAVRRVPAR